MDEHVIKIETNGDPEPKVVHVRDGDLFMIRMPSDVGHDALQEFATTARLVIASIRDRLGANVHMIVLENDTELEQLDDDTMRAHGWIRA